MSNSNNFFNMIIDNMQKIFYPEEWIDLDMKLSKSELFAMLIVERHGEVIMSKIADYINVSMSTATGIIDRLVKNGYLKRERSETDRRVVVIKLTDKGKRVMEDFKSIISKYTNAIFDFLTEEEKELLQNIFFKIIEIINGQINDKEEQNKEDKQLKKIDIE